MRILIIEDNRHLAATLSDLLKTSGYLADIAPDGQMGLDCALSGIYDGIILDVMLPKLDGRQVLTRLRQESSVPVLMLTALGGLSQRVQGLNLGADYYLAKPFENEELLACLQAILRRGGEVSPDTLHFGDLTLTPAACALACGDRHLTLNNKENEIMRLLLSNTDRFLPKETILLKVWGYESDATDNSVEAYISFLRKKLTALHSKVALSVRRNIGYRLEESQ